VIGRPTATRLATLRLALAYAAAVLLGACGGGGSGDALPPPAAAFTDPVLYSTDAAAALPSAAEITSVTHHLLVLGGATLAYTATAGHMTARSLPGQAPEASFFYVAYTLDNREAATRPVTFFYNGGPGSATVWLHLGSFGPKRLVTGDPSTSAPTPFPLIDNAESLLAVTDMVFVDAVGSGLSEAIAPNTNQSFWGVDADAAVFRDFIMRYVAVNNRTASPKFLFGESYGTTRSAVLANMLESAGVQVDGVVLQSSVLNYNTNCAVVAPAVKLSCGSYVPSYGAIGAWFNLDSPNPDSANLVPFLAQMRTLTDAAYEPAVAAFLTMAMAPDAGLLLQLSGSTGLAFAKWQAGFNAPPDYYRANLIPGVLLGRYDARVGAAFGSPLTSEGDPSSTFVAPAFASAIASYLSNDLKYTNPSIYVTLSSAASTWVYAHDQLALPDTIPDLATAMAHNPRLKVLSLSGYHDLATPFFQTERDLSRLGPTANVQLRSYLGGHMTYLDDGARVLEKADLAQFYQAATAAP